MENKQVMSILGLCQRANKLISGEALTLEQIKSNKVKLVLLASDAGPNTTKRITDKSNFYKVEVIHTFPSEMLSQAIGKQNRMVIGIMDVGFSKKIKSLL